MLSEAWQGVNKLGRGGRAATGAAIIPFSEDTLQQTAPLLNGALDPSDGGERISPWKLKILIWSL